MKHPCSNPDILAQNFPKPLEKYEFTYPKDVISHLGNYGTHKNLATSYSCNSYETQLQSFRLKTFFQYPWKKHSLPLFRWSSSSGGCYTCYQSLEKPGCLGSPLEPQQAGGDSKTHFFPEQQSRIRTTKPSFSTPVTNGVFRNIKVCERFV